MEHTLEAYHDEQARVLGPEETQKGLRKVATGFPGVSSETLHRLYQGGQLMSQFNGTKKQLTDLEEQVIVDFAL